MRLETDSIAFLMCLYFVKHPGTTLFADEIVKKWNYRHSSLSSGLTKARKTGWIIATRIKGEKSLAYSAGPTLEAML